MDIISSIFQGKTVRFEKLSSYGFTKKSDLYSYHAVLKNSGFAITVCVSKEGTVTAALTDPATNEPYTLHLVNKAAGRFVGSVKEEYENVLTNIADQCFAPNVFRSSQAQALLSHVKNTYGDELEYLWKTFPNNAVLRRKDTKKWYAVFAVIPQSKLGLPSKETAEIINLRMAPEKIKTILDHKAYFPGWHMNKKTWYTILLDGSVSCSDICRRIDESYHLATK